MLWSLLLVSIVFFIYMAIVPYGKISYSYDFSKPSRFIGKLTPVERVEPIIGNSQKIIGNPVYFSLNLPRGFDTARVSVKYKNNNDDIPVIETGILADSISWNYDLKPIENKIIDKLSLVWNKIDDNGLILLQKEKKYNSIDEFLKSFPARNEVALYNYEPKVDDFRIDKYEPNNEDKIITVPIRGGYEFFTYVQNEELNINYTISDLNLRDGADPVELSLYYNEELIETKKIDDDENQTDDGMINQDREIYFRLADLPAGAYKTVLRAGEDILTKKIISKQKIAFNNKITLSENSGREVSIFTDSSDLFVQTSNPASLQTLKIGDEKVVIDKTYHQFEKKLNGEIEEIRIKSGDIMLSGDGVFSFEKSGLFNPMYKNVDSNLNVQGVNYILAGYSSPEHDDEWKIAKANFDLTKAYSEKGKFGFIISVPGLKADDENLDSLEIKEIKVELFGKTLKQKILDFFEYKSRTEGLSG